MDAKPKLLDVVRARIRAKHYSYRTEEQYVDWIRRFILYSGKRHPADMSASEVSRYLTHLAVERRVSASTQNQALAAILFLYRHVLETDLPWIENVVRARTPQHVPVVLSRREVHALVGHWTACFTSSRQLLYGSGLRLLEALRLRVKDVDFEYSQIVVRDGKGHKDRVTMLPDGAAPSLHAHLKNVRVQHLHALQHGYGGVELPHALAQKYPRAHLDWGWQYVFPAARPGHDPRAGTRRRHHIHERSVQRAVRVAARRTGIDKPLGPHTLRHCFATHLLDAATTSAPCKSSWVIRTFARRRFTRTS